MEPQKTTIDYIHGYIAGLTAMLHMVKAEMEPAAYTRLKEKIKKSVNDGGEGDDSL